MFHSLAGHFLIASPYLYDPNFFRSVVLVLEHTTDGAFGLVINRPGKDSIQSIWEQIEGGACSHESPLYVGGPIAGPLMVLHNRSDDSDLTVLEGMYFASDRDKILRLLSEPPRHVRVFHGYSGWGPQQLDQEMEQGGWLTRAAVARQLFETEPENIWHELTRQVGHDITRSAFKLDDPPNPTWN